MKFGRYLRENQTPEWKRAYIDYRICKKKIKVIETRLGKARPAGEGEVPEDRSSSDGDADHGPSAAPRSVRRGSRSSRGGGGSQTPTPALRSSSRGTPSGDYGATTTSPRPLQPTVSNPPPLDIGEPSVPPPGQQSQATPRIRAQRGPVSFRQDVEHQDGQDEPDGRQRESSNGDSADTEHADIRSADSREPLKEDAAEDELGPSCKPGKSPRFANITSSPKPGGSGSPRSVRGNRSLRSMTFPSPLISTRSSVRSARTFEELYETLESDEKDFFDFLDSEVEKVDKFYAARQNEAIRRAHDLRDQLHELAEHRKLYHELYPEGIPEWEARVERYIPGVTPHLISTQGWGAKVGQALHLRVPEELGAGHRDPSPSDKRAAMAHSNGLGTETDGAKGIQRSRSPKPKPEDREALKQAMLEDKDHLTYSPERYQKYKAELRKAVLEFYRQLELIKNYRIMNLTGFRKALKKFEKVTRIHCMEMYTDERILVDSFAKADTIEQLIKEVEEMYSVHFEHGDAKKARYKLRRQDQHTHTHYTSMFRSGLYLGVGIPAAIMAVVQETAATIAGWDGLLQVYAGLFIPVIFAVLFELNLDAWVNARINYEFVMELSRPTTDFRSYLELPAFLFMTLGICMYFSYFRIGAEHVAPTTWPAAWLVFLAAFFLNPLPIWRRGPRYWLLRVLFRVLTPGYSRVEFIAFFLADELNSLVYTIQVIMFLSCAYGQHWPNNIYAYCPASATWPYILVSIIPALSRCVQCVKRYIDSSLPIHLINAGKYLFTMLQLCFFILWRSYGSPFNGGIFVVWVIIAAITSCYTCTWDFVIDWSLFRPHSGGLRPDLGYGNRYFYYIAMVTNLLVRFVWVWYLPAKAEHTRLRSFFFALAEMLRRWQWNFFRVETEHLGNADAYRVTREIPLPYRRADAESDDEQTKSPLAVHLDQIRKGIVGELGGRGPEALNVGARGHTAQREYEARRPGDSVMRSRTRSTADGAGEEV